MSLTLAEARARAALLSDVSYRLHLDLTDRETFGVRAEVGFALPRAGRGHVPRARRRRARCCVDGAARDGVRRRAGSPLAGLAADNTVTVEARVPYVTDGDGMHTFTDPADGETYVSAYVGMDICQRVFPCFDQNDLKAPVSLTVTAPDGWTVLANGRCVAHRGRRVGVRDHSPDPAADVRRVRGPVALAAPGSTPACRSAGTRGRRSLRSSTATSTSCAR